MKIAKLKKREIIKGFILENISIFLTIFALALISAINQLSMGGSKSYFWKNLLWHFIGLVLFFAVFLTIDYRKITLRAMYIIYGFLLLLLLIMALFKARWINLGFISIQPSEFVKPVLALIISLEVEKASSSVLPDRLFFKLLFVIITPLLLILVTVLVFTFIMGVTFLTFLLFKLKKYY